VEFDGHILGAGHLQDGRGLLARFVNFAVSHVMGQDDLVLAAKVDGLLEEARSQTAAVGLLG